MCCENCQKDEVETQEIENKNLCLECVEELVFCYCCGNKTIEPLDCETEDYCPSCYSDLPACDHCSEIVPSVDDNNHCEDCAKDFCECRYCGETVSNDYVCYDDDGDNVCEACQESGCIPEDSSSWFSYDNLYLHESEGNYYTYEESRSIGQYHYSETCKISSSRSGKYCGFELEIIPNDDRDELATEILELKDLHCEEDSSLDDDGFEIISNYGDIDDVLHLASELSNTLKGNAKSHDTDCCGLHVHLTKTNDFDNAKMIVFWNDPDNRKFIKKFTRRESKDYAAFDSDKSKKNLPKEDFEEFNTQDCKYKSVRITYKGTIEVRAFKGTTLKTTLLACIELAYYSYEYCKTVTSGEDLTYQKFVNWLPEESVHIKPYIASKNFGDLLCV